MYGWFFEQSVAKANQPLCDADNGRKGRPTKVNLVTDNNLALMRWWKKMAEWGLAQKLDSDTKKGDTAFTSGTSAISLESTGSLGGFISDGADRLGELRKHAVGIRWSSLVEPGSFAVVSRTRRGLARLQWTALHRWSAAGTVGR